MSALYHVKSNTVADFTGTVTGFNSQGSTTTLAATNLVRPGDWNSAHKMNGTISGNTSGQSTYSGVTNVVYQGGNNVTLSVATAASVATVVISAANAATHGNWEPWPPIGGGVAFSTLGQNSIYLQKLDPPVNVSFNNIERIVSGSTVSSTNSNAVSHTYHYGLYSKMTGASSSQYSLIASSQMVFQASISSNVSAGFTISQGAGSYTNTSAGTANMSALTGYKHLYMPFTTTMTAGGEYAVAMRMSSATAVGTNAFRMGVRDLSNINNLTIGKLYATTVLATNASFVGDLAQGVYSATSSNLPNTIALSGLTNAVSQQRMYLQFDS